ncbi:MAG: hypothetical protein AB1650_08240 [Candidatus Omnitrophota bacterium]
MKISIKDFGLIIIFSFFIGCAAISPAKRSGGLLNTSEQEDVQEATSALTAVTGAISDKHLNEEELYNAARNMRNDPEARSAVNAISTSFDNKDVKVKYSPATGKRYSADMEYDPETGVKLLPVE